MEQLDSHCTDFLEIWRLRTLRKSAEKIKFALKFDKNNNWYFTRRPMYIYDNTSQNSSKNGIFSDKICRENQNTHFVFRSFFPFENRAVYETMWKNMVEPERRQMAI